MGRIPKDFTGARFGRWMVVGEAPRRGVTRYVLCRCECGTTSEVSLGSLKNGNSKSCGCFAKERASTRGGRRGTIPKDLVGEKYGRLTVISEALRRGKSRHLLCECECGTIKEIRMGNLRNGKSTSCGCFQREQVSTHGLHGTPQYFRWRDMVQRCHNPNHRDYRTYGARGIFVTPAWRESFAKFHEDMGLPPSDNHSIDRIDNNGPYSPENCRWATPKQQANNRGITLRLTHNGETLSLYDWSTRTGINLFTLRQRVTKLGWSDEKALTTPIQKRPKRKTD